MTVGGGGGGIIPSILSVFITDSQVELKEPVVWQSLGLPMTDSLLEFEPSFIV